MDDVMAKQMVNTVADKPAGATSAAADAPARRLKVLLFTNLFPNPGDATRGIFTEQLARELMEISDVTVVCPLPWFPRWSFRAVLGLPS